MRAVLLALAIVAATLALFGWGLRDAGSDGRADDD